MVRDNRVSDNRPLYLFSNVFGMGNSTRRGFFTPAAFAAASKIRCDSSRNIDVHKEKQYPSLRQLQTVNNAVSNGSLPCDCINTCNEQCCRSPLLKFCCSINSKPPWALSSGVLAPPTLIVSCEDQSCCIFQNVMLPSSRIHVGARHNILI